MPVSPSTPNQWAVLASVLRHDWPNCEAICLELRGMVDTPGLQHRGGPVTEQQLARMAKSNRVVVVAEELGRACAGRRRPRPGRRAVSSQLDRCDGNKLTEESRLPLALIQNLSTLFIPGKFRG
jgi:hypothetical protein